MTASQGLAPRRPQPGEPLREGGDDPHFWLDPTLTVTYVENIRDAFSAADPGERPPTGPTPPPTSHACGRWTPGSRPGCAVSPRGTASW